MRENKFKKHKPKRGDFLLIIKFDPLAPPEVIQYQTQVTRYRAFKRYKETGVYKLNWDGSKRGILEMYTADVREREIFPAGRDDTGYKPVKNKKWGAQPEHKNPHVRKFKEGKDVK